jgi:hypothetical protein
MSDSTTQTQSGILGNTHAAAAAATTEREVTKVAWQSSPITQVVIGATLLVIAFILMNTLHWNFFLKLVVGGAIYYVCSKLSGSKIKVLGPWPTVGRLIGIGIIVLAIVQSAFFSLAEKTVNDVEQKVAVAAGTATPAATAVVTPPADPLCTIKTTGQAIPGCQVMTFSEAGTVVKTDIDVCPYARDDRVFIDTVLGSDKKDHNDRKVHTMPGTGSVRTALVFIKRGQTIDNFTCPLN